MESQVTPYEDILMQFDRDIDNMDKQLNEDKLQIKNHQKEIDNYKEHMMLLTGAKQYAEQFKSRFKVVEKKE